MQLCNQNILETMRLANELINLSNKGDVERNDDSCGVLYGIARDMGYRLLELAESEQKSHQQKSKWD